MITALLGALLLTQGQGASGVAPWTPSPVSPFSAAKAEALLRNRLPCLGCHELDGDGGRIGPSLSGLRELRTPAWVYRKVRDPQQSAPGSIMPRVPMTGETLDLIVSYLVQREPTRGSRTVAPPPGGAADPQNGAAGVYARFCAPCHGARGGGDGPNARFLPVAPTAHADATRMATRSDDALFDTISAGGYIMNLSQHMPAYGSTLTRDQIWDLVRYLRTLCRCEGPAWSRDGGS